MIRYYGIFEDGKLKGIHRQGEDGGHNVNDHWSKDGGWKMSGLLISGMGGDHPFEEITEKQVEEFIKAHS